MTTNFVIANYHTTYFYPIGHGFSQEQRVLVKVLLPQYDPEPPVRPVFKFIHGPVTTGRGSQLWYTRAYAGD